MAVQIDEKKCTHCHTCVEACPMGVYKIDAKSKKVIPDNSKCVSCGLCINICPNEAIKFKDE